MNVRVICVGKLKESFYREAAQEFLKRLSRYANVTVVEVSDERAPENLSEAQKADVKRAEGGRILAQLSDSAFAIAMELTGTQLTSVEMAELMRDKMNAGVSEFAFIIGGSLGLAPAVLSRANYRLCFGKPTFSHQIFRIMLLEQIYRSFKIINNEPYHK